MTLGETYFIPASTGKGHLWIIISVPGADGSVLAVNFTKAFPGCDASCIVQAGEHPFIVTETMVAYEHARLLPSEVKKQVEAVCKKHEPVNGDLLARIQKGALVSDEMAQKFQVLLKSQGVTK